MNDCIFCKIVKGEVDAVKIWEDDRFLAFLDLNPNVEGMTLVITKEHHDSYAFDMPDEIYSDLLLAAKKVGGLLEKGLNVQRVSMVMEGMGVNHVHIKLYPLHGLTEKFTEMYTKNRIFFENYEGYISTELGPEASEEELEAVAKKILN